MTGFREPQPLAPRTIASPLPARPNHRQPWTAEDDAAVQAAALAGTLLGDIAAALGRTRESVRNRANLLGVEVRSSPGRGRRRLG